MLHRTETSCSFIGVMNNKLFPIDTFVRRADGFSSICINKDKTVPEPAYYITVGRQLPGAEINDYRVRSIRVGVGSLSTTAAKLVVELGIPADLAAQFISEVGQFETGLLAEIQRYSYI